MADSEKNKVGFWIAFALIVGNMIGSGIFLLPSNLAVYGGISIYGWIFSTIGALSLAYVFGKLSKKIKRGGGPYTYTYEGFGDFAGFWIAWGYWISCWAAVASISIAFTGAIAVFFPVLSDNPLFGAVFSCSIIFLLTMINLQDLKKVGMVQLVTTILKLLPIFAIAILGFSKFDPSHFQPFNQSDEGTFSAITATVTLTLWAFLGFESATIISHRVKNAEIVVPKATMYGTLFVAVVYVSSSIAIMGLIPPETLQSSTAPFADAGAVLWGDTAKNIIALGTGIACFGAMNGWVLIQGQIPHAAAEDKLFPRFFSNLNKNGVPQNGVIISSSLAIILILSTYKLGIVKQFQILILLATLTAVIPYAFCTMTYWLKYIKGNNTDSKLRKIWEGLIIFIAFAFSVFAIYGSGKDTVFSGFLLLIAGLPVYIWMKK